MRHEVFVNNHAHSKPTWRLSITNVKNCSLVEIKNNTIHKWRPIPSPRIEWACWFLPPKKYAWSLAMCVATKLQIFWRLLDTEKIISKSRDFYNNLASSRIFRVLEPKKSVKSVKNYLEMESRWRMFLYAHSGTQFTFKTI